jgi:hypothetical protein
MTDDDASVARLEARFIAHPERHRGVHWTTVERCIAPATLAILQRMEASGGEPDVIAKGDELLYVDCAAESPIGRRSLCFDEAALIARKVNPPRGSVEAMAAGIGIELLDEAGYRHLHTVGRFDAKTSSWIATPPDVRALGGALFADWRYGRVFVYHNGAQSYYAARGFRGCLRLY